MDYHKEQNESKLNVLVIGKPYSGKTKWLETIGCTNNSFDYDCEYNYSKFFNGNHIIFFECSTMSKMFELNEKIVFDSALLFIDSEDCLESYIIKDIIECLSEIGINDTLVVFSKWDKEFVNVENMIEYVDNFTFLSSIDNYNVYYPLTQLC